MKEQPEIEKLLTHFLMRKGLINQIYNVLTFCIWPVNGFPGLWGIFCLIFRIEHLYYNTELEKFIAGWIQIHSYSI